MKRQKADVTHNMAKNKNEIGNNVREKCENLLKEKIVEW